MKWHGFEGFVFAGDVGVKIGPYTIHACGLLIYQIGLTYDRLNLTKSGKWFFGNSFLEVPTLQIFFTSQWWPALLLVFSRMFFGKALTQITSDMLHLMLLKVFTFVGEGAVIA